MGGDPGNGRWVVIESHRGALDTRPREESDNPGRREPVDESLSTRAWEGTRTPDLRITNALLYQLSYPGDVTDQNYLTDIGAPWADERGYSGQPVTAERRTSIASSSSDSLGLRTSSAADRSTTEMAPASSRTRSSILPDRNDGMGPGAANVTRRSR
jgi:hypothetical protein